MEKYIKDLKETLDKLDIGIIASLVKIMKEANRIWIIGNGGSCSTASHIAEDILKYTDIRILALSCPSSITMCGNDYGFDDVFYIPLKKLATHKDLVIGLSTSGTSRNIYKVMTCPTKYKTFLICGNGGRDVPCNKLVIPSNNTQILEDVMLTIGHLISKYYMEV